jgi:hypothetical protein
VDGAGHRGTDDRPARRLHPPFRRICVAPTVASTPLNAIPFGFVTGGRLVPGL